jgi:DNA-binding MarR family transcriptional regulator
MTTRHTAELPLGPALGLLQRLWRLNHALERLSSRMERQLGVTAQQRLVIRCLGKYPGMTAGQLAGLLHVDPGTVSAALNRLERKGLVLRRRDPKDKRRASLGLTERGRDLDRPSDGTVESAVERAMLGAGPLELDAATALLDRIVAALEHESAS